MYKLCKTEQSAARQRQLEQALLEMMLQQRYEDISISDLCQRTGTPRKAFYRYFTCKDGALFSLLDHTMLEFYSEGFRGAGGSALGDLKQFFLFWYQHRDLMEALERNHLSGMMLERAIDLATREKLMPRKILAWSSDLQGAAMSFAVSGLMAMAVQWHRQNYAISPDKITQVAVSMLTKPLVHVPPQPTHKHGD